MKTIHETKILKTVTSVGCALALSAALAACTGMPAKPDKEKVAGKPATGQAVDPETGKKASRENAKRMRDAWKGKTFAEFKAQTYREPFAGGKFIVNGDTPIANEKLLREFFENEIQQEPPPPTSPLQLIIHAPGGQVAAWNSNDKRQLTYCISKEFGSRHSTVVADMAAATTAAWSKVADVSFIHVPSLDDNCNASTQGVVFDVRPVNVNGQYLARAFFPNESRAERNVLIDESSFSLDPGGALTLVGILRHELGHTLGFRHEHTRPESGTCFEDSEWKPLTGYDALSVMHYPQCNGQGDWSLTLTNFDKNGAACQYGAAPGFTIDPNLCLDPPAPPPATGCRTATATITNQQVAANQEKQHGSFAVAPGTKLEVKMLGNGAGDPDLYVRFGQAPTRNQFTCRPYTAGAEETCSLDVPSNQTKAFVMVHGYSAANYHLVVTHTMP